MPEPIFDIKGIEPGDLVDLEHDESGAAMLGLVVVDSGYNLNNGTHVLDVRLPNGSPSELMGWINEGWNLKKVLESGGRIFLKSGNRDQGKVSTPIWKTIE